MPAGLQGKRQSLLHFSHGQRRCARPGQSERPLPGRTRGDKRDSSRRPGLRGCGRRTGEGVRDGSPSSDFGKRRRRAPNCGVERVPSEEMGQRETESLNLPGAAPRRERSQVSSSEEGDKKRPSSSAETKRDFCYETKGTGATAGSGDFEETREGRRSAAVTAALVPEFETPSHPHPPPGWGRGRIFPPPLPQPPLTCDSNPRAQPGRESAFNSDTHNSPLPVFSQFFIHSTGSTTVAAAIFLTPVTEARMCSTRARRQR